MVKLSQKKLIVNFRFHLGSLLVEQIAPSNVPKNVSTASVLVLLDQMIKARRLKSNFVLFEDASEYRLKNVNIILIHQV
jgi:hypothetical protein